jgi:hypothetical protein
VLEDGIHHSQRAAHPKAEAKQKAENGTGEGHRSDDDMPVVPVRRRERPYFLIRSGRLFRRATNVGDRTMAMKESAMKKSCMMLNSSAQD